MSTRKMATIGVVILLHVGLGYAFMTGLAINVVKKMAVDLKTFDVADDLPPPPPPPPEQKVAPPPVVAPPPIVAPVVSAPPVISVTPPAPPVIHEEAPAAPPKPMLAVPAKPKGNPGNWVTNDDYPSQAMRDGAQGVTGFELTIGTDGKVTGCNVTSSSGSSLLDETACKYLVRRARFAPAQDVNGNAIPATYRNRVRWQIPE